MLPVGTQTGLVQVIRKEPLLCAVLLAVVVGVSVGSVLRGSSLSARDIEMIGEHCCMTMTPSMFHGSLPLIVTRLGPYRSSGRAHDS